MLMLILMLKCWSWCCSWHFGHLVLGPQECFRSSSSVPCKFWLQHRGDLEREISLKLSSESLLKNHKVVVGAGRILTSRPTWCWCWCWCWHLDQGQQGHMHIVSTAGRISTSRFWKVVFKKKESYSKLTQGGSWPADLLEVPLQAGICSQDLGRSTQPHGESCCFFA